MVQASAGCLGLLGWKSDHIEGFSLHRLKSKDLYRDSRGIRVYFEPNKSTGTKAFHPRVGDWGVKLSGLGLRGVGVEGFRGVGV